ncbi:hypothetical protein N8766_01035, partial [bacterium]|nr:hypothetical protein [bacterium]
SSELLLKEFEDFRFPSRGHTASSPLSWLFHLSTSCPRGNRSKSVLAVLHRGAVVLISHTAPFALLQSIGTTSRQVIVWDRFCMGWAIVKLSADLLGGEGKLMLAWLTGRSPYLDFFYSERNKRIGLPSHGPD